MNELNLELFSFEVFKDEKWSFIPKIKNKYIVSTHGRVALFIKGRYKLASTFISKQGYPTFRYSDKGKIYNHRIHRLVGAAFLPNPNNYPQINHIDENRTNNHVENLEWCTAKHNLEHSGIIKKWSKAGTEASVKARLNGTIKHHPHNPNRPKQKYNYIKNKTQTYKRYYSKCRIYAFNENHELFIYNNFQEASTLTGIGIDHIALSCAFNRKAKELIFHSNGVFFSIEDDFWSWTIKQKIDVAQYFKELQ